MASDPNIKIHDKFGKEINIGSYVAYGARVGDSSKLVVGKVLAITNNKPNSWSDKRVPKVRVMWVDKSWQGKIETYTSTVGDFDRMLILEKLPEPALSLIEHDNLVLSGYLPHPR